MALLDPKFRFLPVDLLVTQKFDSISKVGSLQLPLLLIHGLADDEIPAAMSQRLFAVAPDPKDLVLIPGGGHSNTADVAEPLYLDTIRAFLHTMDHQLP
jgi:hypothetical protein